MLSKHSDGTANYRSCRYIKKSVLTGMIMLSGGIILLAVAVVFCFTEVTVSRYVCLAVWLVCIWGVSVLTKKIAHSKKRPTNVFYL